MNKGIITEKQQLRSALLQLLPEKYLAVEPCLYKHLHGFQRIYWGCR